MPKIFRLTSKGKLSEAIFKGETINTPSMLCVEDAIDGLKWAAIIGGQPELISRAEANLAAVAAWVAKHAVDRFPRRGRAPAPAPRSASKFADAWFTALSREAQAEFVKKSPRCSKRKTSPTTSPAIATRRRACASGAAPRSSTPTSPRCCPGSTGPTAS